MVAVLYIERKYCSRFGSILYSSLIIAISLQLRGCRQIVEPRKYCLVCVIVFLWRMFSLFFLFVSHRLGIRLNSLHHMPHNSFISTMILIQTQARSQFLHRFQPHKKWFFWWICLYHLYHILFLISLRNDCFFWLNFVFFLCNSNPNMVMNCKWNEFSINVLYSINLTIKHFSSYRNIAKQKWQFQAQPTWTG